MSRFDQDLERDLGQIADRATPSPDAWNSILERIDAQEPITETEIIMLTDNTLTTRRWPRYAAAAAVVGLLIGGLALANRDEGAEVPASPPTPTVAVEPEPESEIPEVVDLPLTLPEQGALVAPGRYRTDAIGTPVEFELQEGQTAPWTLVTNDPAGIQLISDDTGREFMAIGRVGSWFDAVESRTEETRGLGNIPADGIDTWIAVNDVIVVESAEISVGGRDAKYRLIRLDTSPGATADFCPEGEAPCLWAASGSADLIDAESSGVPIGRDRVQALWSVDMGEFEPVFIFAAANLDDDGPWFTDIVQPIIDSIQFGEPAPLIEGGTARLPARVTVTADMTVTQTGERDISEPWPIERTGPIVGNINGTFTGTGMSSPNGAEVTLDWVMDVTVDGLGTGTLTLRSYETWSGDGATTAANHVLSGTGDLEGVTGFGTTTHTDDGSTFTATIELMLAPPAI